MYFKSVKTVKYHWPVKSSEDQSQFYIHMSVILQTCTPQMLTWVILAYNKSKQCLTIGLLRGGGGVQNNSVA